MVETPFEIHFRKMLNSGTYQVINKDNLKNIIEQNLNKDDLKALRPKNQEGLIKNIKKIYILKVIIQNFLHGKHQ